MKTAVRPLDEIQRQQALHALGILDTGPEERFERISRLTKRSLGVSIVFITFIDGDRLWLKSSHGVVATELPRDITFCSHAVLENDILCVPDARKDPRFADSPLVVESPHIRFYAGAPFRAPSGHIVGTLCVADPEARACETGMLEMLRDFADCVEDELIARGPGANDDRRMSRLAHAILDAALDAVVATDADGTIRTANPAAARMFQYAAAELVGSDIQDLIAPSEADHQEARGVAFLQILEKQSDEATTIAQGHRKDASAFPVELRVSSLADADQRLFVCVIRDLSAQRSQERFLDTIVENIPTMVFVKEARDLRFTLFNKAGEALLGIPRSDLIGKNDYDFFPKEQADWFVEKDREVLAHPGVVEIPEEPLDTANGPRILHTWKTAIRDASGTPRYLLGISEDITDRKKIERHLAESLARAERASRGKTQFLANMSHELRSPLNIIIGFTQLMMQGIHGDLTPKHAEYADDILQSAKHLLGLINEILDTTKIESGDFSVVEGEFDLSIPATEAVKWVGVGASEKGLTLRNEVTEGQFFLRADMRLIRQIFINLLWNAIKFTPSGGDVWASATKRDDGGISLCVADTGIGIAAEDIPTALEPFGQVQSSAMHATEGTGLGLSLTKRVAELHGGRLTIESEPGKGTTVTIELPANRTLSDA